MGNLWNIAIDRAKELSDEFPGDLEVRPEHEYFWKIVSPGWTLDMRTSAGDRVPFSILSYLQDDPANGWETYYVHVADALVRLNKETLFVGAGTGRYLNMLTNSGIESYGIDVSDMALDLMAARGIENVEKMDGAYMTFEDNAFPLVCLPRDTLNYSMETELLIREACRVASETVVIGSDRHGTNSEEEPTGHAVTMEWMGETASCIFTGYPQNYFTALLDECGFEVERITDHYGYWLLEAQAA